jgi:hypothetical protein
MTLEGKRCIGSNPKVYTMSISNKYKPFRLRTAASMEVMYEWWVGDEHLSNIEGH